MHTPLGYALGHVPGPLPEGTLSTRHLFGARRFGLSGDADFSQYVDRVRDQGKLQSCVGMSLARVVHVRGQQEKYRTPNPAGIAYPSELGIYALAREEEAAGPDEELEDRGSVPGLALMALQRDVGVPLERDWPYDPDKVDVRLPADVVAAAMALKVTGAYEVISAGAERVDDCVQALLEGFPFQAAIKVGPEYEGCRDQAPVGPASTVYGGHAIAIIGLRTVNGRRQFLNCGSWGPAWGWGGYAWLDEDVLADPRTGEIIVVTVAPDPDAASTGRT